MKVKTAKEPLIRIAKRTNLSTSLSYGIRIASVLLALLACGITLMLITNGKVSFGEVYSDMIDGAFGTIRRVKITAREGADTVAVCEAVIKSTQTGLPEKVKYCN